MVSRSRLSSSESKRNGNRGSADEDTPGPPAAPRIVPSAAPDPRCGMTEKKTGVVPAPGLARSSGTSMEPHRVPGGSSQGASSVPDARTARDLTAAVAAREGGDAFAAQDAGTAQAE